MSSKTYFCTVNALLYLHLYHCRYTMILAAYRNSCCQLPAYLFSCDRFFSFERHHSNFISADVCFRFNRLISTLDGWSRDTLRFTYGCDARWRHASAWRHHHRQVSQRIVSSATYTTIIVCRSFLQTMASCVCMCVFVCVHACVNVITVTGKIKSKTRLCFLLLSHGIWLQTRCLPISCRWDVV